MELLCCLLQAVDLTSDWQPGCGLWADKGMNTTS